MSDLARETDAFIRPSPSAGALGGVALRTRESLLLCEAAGFDVIMVETVGVGQSEFDVAAMVDLFMVLLLPNAGDELQGIKRGILELAHLLVINKADGDHRDEAARARGRYEGALSLLRQVGPWKPRAVTCSALENEDIHRVWETVSDFATQSIADGSLEQERQRQSVIWMDRLVTEILQQQLMARPSARDLREQLEAEVRSARITPFAAATRLAGTC